MRFARFELSLKKTRKQEKKKQIKIEMRFGFFMFHLKKRRDTNQATKIKKNQTRFEIFFENSLEKYKKKTKLVFLCFLLSDMICVNKCVISTVMRVFLPICAFFFFFFF